MQSNKTVNIIAMKGRSDRSEEEQQLDGVERGKRAGLRVATMRMKAIKWSSV